MTERTALIFGVGGQDGAYLSALLIAKGYRVHGTTRGGEGDTLIKLQALGVADAVTCHKLSPLIRADVDRVIGASDPTEIYYFAGQSSVARSFDVPEETLNGAVTGLFNTLESARAIVPQARILHAASGDCFGETTVDRPATETTPFAPRSPYAAAKAGAHHLLAVNRLAHAQWASSAFLFSHESPLRDVRFVTAKIVQSARRIADGSGETLKLGDLSVVRDWGWAPDYVEAMWRMLQLPDPADLIIATGASISLEQFVAAAFAAVNLDWRDHVHAATTPRRPADIAVQHADPSRARELLAWRATTGGVAVADRLLDAVVTSPAG